MELRRRMIAYVILFLIEVAFFLSVSSLLRQAVEENMAYEVKWNQRIVQHNKFMARQKALYECVSAHVPKEVCEDREDRKEERTQREK